MLYKSYYQSPIGKILLTADEIGLTGLWLEGQRGFEAETKETEKMADISLIERTKKWLDIYFAGKEPDFMPPIHLIGSDFQNEVWDILCMIPYGTVRTYGDIAKQIAEKRGLKRMSAQAVGGAVGGNKISIIVPCHRVVGTNGSLTGYSGGIDKKIQLLSLEKVDMTSFWIPKQMT